MINEISAGAVVSKGDKVLLVKVCNLAQEKVWTFPKGHLEKGETALEAALREVAEETGWRCRPLTPLMTAAYRFRRKGRLVDKRVKWYWFKPLEKVGKPDADEILSVKWVARPKIASLLKYPSDFKLLQRWVKTAAARNSHD